MQSARSSGGVRLQRPQIDQVAQLPGQCGIGAIEHVKQVPQLALTPGQFEAYVGDCHDACRAGQEIRKNSIART